MRHKISFPTLAYAPSATAPLLLSQREQNIFRFLKRAADNASPAVELRVAGGWVRDKLLGRDTGDIDIAVRFTTGIRFAEHVQSVARSSRVAFPAPSCSEYVPVVSSVTRIKPNPAMSRHLETAAVRLDNIDLDFVHLRTDDYAEDNRIPTVRHGTPVQDAYRRDFTVNSLFYNLQNREIEDLTSRGLSDLESRLLRTPLDPCTTLLDDPLRALRAVRFACTLDFDICPRLSDALEGTQLRAVLRRKVSRERVGLEVMQVVASNDPVRGLNMIADYGLATSVFGARFSGLTGEIAFREGIQRVRDALGIVSQFEKLIPSKDVEAFKQYGREVLIFASLIGEIDRIQPALGDSLRRDRRLQQDVKRVLMHSERLLQIIWEWGRVRGKRHLKEREEAIWIHIAEVVRDAGHDLWIPVVTICAQQTGGNEIVKDLLLSGISSEICGLPYAVDGDRLQTELGIRKGPEVGEALKDLMKVQLCYFRRDGHFDKNRKETRKAPTAEDCVARLKARRALAEELVKT